VLIVLDACTLINLVNGEVLDRVLDLPNCQFLVSPMVREELPTIAEAVDHAVESRRLSFVDDEIISAKEFAEAKQVMHLGNGETECILAAEKLGCHVACDDRQARQKAKDRLGDASRVVGSIGLLRMLCDANFFNQEQAFAAYRLMCGRGGYLPDLTVDAFVRKPA
jgi:predicted nucleic acid-binding protein